MLMDNFLEIHPGGRRPHFPMVGLKKNSHTVELSGLVVRGLLARPVGGWHYFRYIWSVRWQTRRR